MEADGVFADPAAPDLEKFPTFGEATAGPPVAATINACCHRLLGAAWKGPHASAAQALLCYKASTVFKHSLSFCWCSRGDPGARGGDLHPEEMAALR